VVPSEKEEKKKKTKKSSATAPSSADRSHTSSEAAQTAYPQDKRPSESYSKTGVLIARNIGKRQGSN